jgi:thymidylate synthase (FAD)
MKINIITEPKIYVIGSQVVNNSELKRFLNDEGISNWETDTQVPGEKLIEHGGRLCYMSFRKPRPGGNKSYIKHILEVKHGSVLEHCVFTIVITGISRRCCEQLTRQRVGWSPSQLSQRFVDETDDNTITVVLPPEMRRHYYEYLRFEKSKHDYDEEINRQNIYRPLNPTDSSKLFESWKNTLEVSAETYESLSEELYEKMPESLGKTARRKAAREAARSVLPNCTETKIQITCNARALRHFIELRAEPSADAEIRILAINLLYVLRDISPNVFGDYDVLANENGVAYALTQYPKV